jgi:alkylated DNA nucleotide flippase Atl1
LAGRRVVTAEDKQPVTELGELRELPCYVQAVLDLVDQIPLGMVLSYGDIAELLGGGGPRQVGAVLSRYGSAVTWWRVTRATGEAPVGLRGEAAARWRSEGTPMALMAGAAAGENLGGRVDMMRARWDGPDCSDSPAVDADTGPDR